MYLCSCEKEIFCCKVSSYRIICCVYSNTWLLWTLLRSRQCFISVRTSLRHLDPNISAHGNVKSFLIMAGSTLTEWFYRISTCFNIWILPFNPQQSLYCIYIPSKLPVWLCSSLKVWAGAGLGCRTPGSTPKVRIPSRSWYCPDWMSCRWATEWTACGREEKQKEH